MASSTFDTLSAARELESKGFEPDQAEAIVFTVRQSSGDHITADQFDARFSEMRAYVDSGLTAVRAHIDRQSAMFHRALWIQGVAIVGVLAGLYALAGGG